jgi:hypothetical protein
MTPSPMLAMFILCAVVASGGVILFVLFWRVIGNMHKPPRPPPGFPGRRGAPTPGANPMKPIPQWWPFSWWPFPGYKRPMSDAEHRIFMRSIVPKRAASQTSTASNLKAP